MGLAEFGQHADGEVNVHEGAETEREYDEELEVLNPEQLYHQPDLNILEVLLHAVFEVLANELDLDGQELEQDAVDDLERHVAPLDGANEVFLEAGRAWVKNKGIRQQHKARKHHLEVVVGDQFVEEVTEVEPDEGLLVLHDLAEYDGRSHQDHDVDHHEEERLQLDVNLELVSAGKLFEKGTLGHHQGNVVSLTGENFL